MIHQRSQSIIAGLLLTYTLTIGGRWSGILDSRVATLSLCLLALLVGAWAVWRTLHRWHWHWTALDGVLLLWLVAFGISTLTNWQARGSIAIGLWFAGLYILGWYMLQDMRGNGLITGQHLINGLLLSGMPVILSALADEPVGTSRVSGFLANPNTLGTFLALIIPLAIMRATECPGRWRLVWIGYLAVALTSLVLTQSRGALLGICAAIGFVVILHRPQYRLILVVCAVLLTLGFTSLRGDSSRLPIYRRALRTFISHPLNGTGLFTFSIRPYPDYSQMMQLHAHNVGLQIGAELGIPGLVALAVTVIALGRAAWQDMTAGQSWVAAALIGVMVHQLFDFTIMTPGIALGTLVALNAAIPPGRRAGPGARWAVWLLLLLAALLLGTGLISGRLPRRPPPTAQAVIVGHSITERGPYRWQDNSSPNSS